jgi:hypothetical protein
MKFNTLELSDGDRIECVGVRPLTNPDPVLIFFQKNDDLFALLVYLAYFSEFPVTDE